MVTREIVIAIDPGERTGWAVGELGLDHFRHLQSGVYQRIDMESWLAQRLGVIRPTHTVYPRIPANLVVIESWRPYRLAGSLDHLEGDPMLFVQHVGGLKAIARLAGVAIKEQSPSQKKSFAKSYPDKLIAVDVESKEVHDCDARLHLWGYFFSQWFTGEVDPEDCIDG